MRVAEQPIRAIALLLPGTRRVHASANHNWGFLRGGRGQVAVRHGGTLAWRLMRSSGGLELRLRNFFTSRGVQVQLCSGWPRWLHGQGLIVRTSISRAGNVTDIEACAIIIHQRSSGIRLPRGDVGMPPLLAFKERLANSVR